MSEARSRDEWRRTAALLALIANVNRDPARHRPFLPADFNPHEQKPKAVIKGEGLRIMKDIFVKTDPRPHDAEADGKTDPER